MKRTYFVVILMFVLAACGSSSTTGTGGGPSGSPSSEPAAGPASSPTAGPASEPAAAPSNSPSVSAYSTVSGQVVERGTGRPYPNAWVRFGWLVSAGYEQETHTVTDGSGRYSIQLPPGQYQVTAGDSCELNAGFDIAGRAPDDNMITVPGTSEVDFVEYPITSVSDPAPC